MDHSPSHERRQFLVTAALALTPSWSAAAAAAGTLTGQPGDFDFLAGEWRIRHRRLKAPGQWDEFDGEATVHGVLAGIASIEELRIPARDFSGMGVRILDVKAGRWADYWVNGKEGILSPPPLWGGFVDGAGIFTSDEEETDGKKMIYRGTWDRITKTSCRWHQASSADGGKSLDPNWFMDWRRAA